jgi:hypothetical protein
MDRISSLAVELAVMQGMLAGSFHRKLPGTAAVLVFQGELISSDIWYHGSCVNAACKIVSANCDKIFFTFTYPAKVLFTNKNYVEIWLINSNFQVYIMCQQVQ